MSCPSTNKYCHRPDDRTQLMRLMQTLEQKPTRTSEAKLIASKIVIAIAIVVAVMVKALHFTYSFSAPLWQFSDKN